jgi:hypothetical protein
MGAKRGERKIPQGNADDYESKGIAEIAICKTMKTKT